MSTTPTASALSAPALQAGGHPAGRNTCISICKGIAIILMVMGHAEGPALLMNFIYLFHMPLFFITAGYFFSRKYEADPWAFCVKRVKGLYVPFVKWSLVFLVLHNLFFRIGLLNERFGNWEGGVTHPYSLQQFLQRLTEIVLSMGGYDEFLAGAFWFFRALFVVSIVFLILMVALHGRRRWLTTDATLGVIAALALGFAFLKIAFGLKVVTLVQGGIRECWGLFFFAFGLYYRRHEGTFRQRWWLTLGYLLVLAIGAVLHLHGMTLKPSVIDVVTLPVTGIVGFLMVHHIASTIDRRESRVKRALVYCGDHTLIIFVLHIVAFKAVSALKILAYGLDWGQIGCHMVIHYRSTDAFFLLYTLAGVGLPLAAGYAWRRVCSWRSARAI